MDTILISLAVLGFATVMLAIYVLALMTGKMDSALDRQQDGSRVFGSEGFRERSPVDRRQAGAVYFPLVINGVMIEHDRRVLPDRRQDFY